MATASTIWCSCRRPASTNSVTIVFGRPEWPRELNAGTLPAAATFFVTFLSPDFQFTVDALNWNGDGRDDLLITTHDEAYLITGAAIDGDNPNIFFDATPGGIDPFDAEDGKLHLIRRDATTAALNGHAHVLGDVNGDGVDDLAFVDSNVGAAAQGFVLLSRGTEFAGSDLTVVENGNLNSRCRRPSAMPSAWATLTTMATTITPSTTTRKPKTVPGC